MKGWVDKARRPEMIGGIGGFAGLFDASALTRYERPLLATSTDGVGTKVAIAQAMDVHDTIGFDLVGMVVDDLVVCGAEPLFMTDYIATGRVVPERIAAIVKGIAEACVEAGCALIGGETAEHPGLLGPDEYDVAGRDHRGGGGRPAARARPGAAGRRRHGDGGQSGCTPTATPWCATCCSRRAAGRSTAHVDELGRTARRGAARAHPDLRQGLPGPGAADRTSTRCRTSPAAGWPPTSSGCCRSSSPPPSTGRRGHPSRSSTWYAASAASTQAELEATLNCGVGMVALTPADDVGRAIGLLDGHGIRAWAAGEVRADDGGDGRVALVGQHPGW